MDKKAARNAAKLLRKAAESFLWAVESGDHEAARRSLDEIGARTAAMRQGVDARPDPEAARPFWRRYGLGIALNAALLAMFVVANASWARAQRGRGLTAEYFLDSEFRRLERSARVDTVDFRFGPRSPANDLNIRDYSIRFSGYLKPDVPGDYELWTLSDGGVRMWVDGRPVIDELAARTMRRDVVSVRLESRAIPIRIDYVQLGKESVIRLFWRRIGSNQSGEVIPASNLVPEAPPSL